MKTDNELFLEFVNGNKKAFEIIMERYMKRAYYMTYGYLGDEELAMDISQNAFMKVYKENKRFDNRFKFSTWFFTILRNMCLNAIKKRKIHRECQLDKKLSVKNEVDLKIDMSEAISRLNRKERELIKLKYYDGFSYEEISEMLEIPIGTVMSGMFYAKKHLKVVLTEMDNNGS